ncbi:MAG: Hsp20/alpha crystallin family protein [Acidobacteria bacterium]|nr:Hsp20/alpha crystallin family protein [Acidobacteriota bacterium]
MATVLEKTTERQPVRRQFHDAFADLFEEMERLAGLTFAWPRTLVPSTRVGGWSPKIDVFEKEGWLVIQADLPGTRKEDVEVCLEDGDLVLRGERQSEKEVKEEHFFRAERAWGKFYRRMPLPVEVKAEEIEATFKDGVLEIRIPKPPAGKKASEKIKIK